MQAKCRLGFDDLVRHQVEVNICQLEESEDQDLDYVLNTYSNCFYIPLLIVYNILDKRYFESFLNSKMYLKYKSEILENTKFEQKIVLETGEKPISKEPKSENFELWSNIQIGKIDKVGKFIRYLEREPSRKKTHLPENYFDDDIWQLYDDSENNIQLNKKNNNFSLKEKLEKFKSYMPLGTGSKFTPDDYETAERIAANLVNEVIKLNHST